MKFFDTLLEWYVAGSAFRAGERAADRWTMLFIKRRNNRAAKKAELARQKKLVTGGKK